MSESGDYEPATHWGGHDFSSARAAYQRHVDRGYSQAQVSGTKNYDLLPKQLTTKSKRPLVILTDVTSSMQNWPEVMFSKLPYLEHEVQTEYLGADAGISFGAFGDAHSGENYALQFRPFAKGSELATRMKELVITCGGGGQMKETSELGMLYLARNVSMSKATHPICIIITDEMPYDSVAPDMAESEARVKIAQRMTTEEIVIELKQKFSVYLIRKPDTCYGSSGRDGMSGANAQIHKRWADLVGEDRISILPDAGRVVDVIFGILAAEVGKIEYFYDELSGRQTPRQVATVTKSLSTIHDPIRNQSVSVKPKKLGRSKLHIGSSDELG